MGVFCRDGILTQQRAPAFLKGRPDFEQSLPHKPEAIKTRAGTILYESGRAADDVERSTLALRCKVNHALDDLAREIGVDLHGYLKSVQPILTVGQVAFPRCDGHEIGAHSVDHAK
ncbi:MAG: hypothetical protein N3G20_08585 [Verrucomicrobiae bacterium]|nr:hypothetical protein [Verrucomicrobiae bacterium]